MSTDAESRDAEPVRRGVAIGMDISLLAAISMVVALPLVLSFFGLLPSRDIFFVCFVLGLAVYVLGPLAVVVRWKSWTTIERCLSMLVLIPAAFFLCYIVMLFWLLTHFPSS